MIDCAEIDRKLGLRMVKTLLLCTRHQADYFLFVTAGDRPFRAGAFSATMHCARVSFAPREMLPEKLGVQLGAATAFGLLCPQARDVPLVVDRRVAEQPFFGCSDGTTTGVLRQRTADVLERLFPGARVLEVADA